MIENQQFKPSDYLPSQPNQPQFTPRPVEPPTKFDLKRMRTEQAIRRKKMQKIIWIAGISLILIIVIGSIVWLSYRRVKNAPGIFYPSLGQEHIGLKDNPPKPYNSNPPSSGGHFASPANWGIYDYEVNDKIFIHNLEHGGIWIAYRPTVSAKVVNELKAIINEFGGSKIVMAPRSSNDADVAMAAWSRVLKFNLTGDFLSDKEKEDLRGFYKAFKNHGPEFVPDTMPGIDPKSVQ